MLHVNITFKRYNSMRDTSSNKCMIIRITTATIWRPFAKIFPVVVRSHPQYPTIISVLVETSYFDLDSKKNSMENCGWRGCSHFLDGSCRFILYFVFFQDAKISKNLRVYYHDMDRPWWVEVAGETRSSIPQGDCCVFDINHSHFYEGFRLKKLPTSSNDSFSRP